MSKSTAPADGESFYIDPDPQLSIAVDVTATGDIHILQTDPAMSGWRDARLAIVTIRAAHADKFVRQLQSALAKVRRG